MAEAKLLIGKSGKGDALLDAKELVTGRTCVIAQSGAGKSYLIAVMCEKMLEAGAGFCIVDTEGEYNSLKEKFDILWIGPAGSADEDIESADIGALCERAMRENIPMIFDVSESDERAKVAELAKALYAAATRLRVPYLLILEEADKFVPQGKDSLKEIEEISKRGRKRGLGLLVATQRPAIVNKNVLSQCGMQFIGRLTTENDLAAVKLFFDSRDDLVELSKLEPGFFYMMSRGKKVRMRSVERITTHKGATPELRLGRTEGAAKEAKASARPAAEEKACPLSMPADLSSVASKIVGIEPKLKREDVLKLAEKKRKKKFLVFGSEERLESVDMLCYPLVYVKTKGAYGIFKRIREHSFILDGVSGNIAEVNNGLRLRPGLSSLVGLSEDELRVLFALDGQRTVAEIEAKTRMGEDAIREALRSLEKKKCITCSGKVGRSRQYARLIDAKPPSLTLGAALPKVVKLSGNCAPHKISQEQVRAIVKAQNPMTDIVEFKPFYYPLYRARLSKRVLMIDGVTGEEVDAATI
ncbi:MAG: DUF87 domain-containing protein [Candidatus Aenigmatarchaeota archaeon]